MTAITASKGTLKELGSAQPVGDWSTTLIAVPDIGKPHSALKWSDGTGCWLFSQLPSLPIEPRIFEFQYGPINDQDFSWDYLVQWGDVLLDQLLSLDSLQEFTSRPLIFICHGIGGIILKQTVGIMHKNSHKLPIKQLLQSLAGIVFMGTPHPTFAKPHEWFRLSLLLRSCTNLSWKFIERNVAQISVTARISQLFEDADIEAPVLSVYEGKPTKISSGLISSKREILVDSISARIGVRREFLKKVDAPHSGLCMHPLASPHGQLQLQSDRAFPSTDFSELFPELLDPVMTSNAATAGLHSDMSSFEMLPSNEAIQGLNQSINLPQHRFKPYTRNPGFFGRKEILRIMREILRPPVEQSGFQGQPSRKTFALCGAGGLGKTQLAVEFAYVNKSDYDAIFIVQASDTEKLAQSFSEMSVALGLEDESLNQIVSINLVLGWLSEPIRQLRKGGKPLEGESTPSWLLVFDNADDLNVLRDFWPDSANGSILVTSRDPLAKTRTHVSISNGIDLEPFVLEEAGLLLRKLTGYSSSEDVLLSEEVAERLSGLPLALVQIAGTITRRDLTFQEFLALYDKDSSRSKIYKTNVLSSAKTLYTVWNFQDLSASALSLLNIISHLDPDKIPEALLQQMDKVDSSKIPTNYPLSNESFVEARSELSRSSLVKRNRDTRELTIHRIIQDAARSWMEPKMAYHNFVSTTFLLYSTWPFSEFEFSPIRWRLCEPIVPQVVALYRLCKDDSDMTSNKDIISLLARLFMDFGWYFIERGNLRESHRYFESCTRLCDLDPGSTQIWRGDNEGCMAQAASLTGDYHTAIYHAEISVHIFQKYDNRTWRLRQAYNELAEAYLAEGRYEEALTQAELGIKGPFNIPTSNPPDWPNLNKAFALIHLGRLEEASEVLEAFLISREERLGPMDSESHKTGQGLYFLGKVRFLQSRFPESLDLHLKALAQYHSTVGPGHFRVAALYDRIGDVYVSLEQWDEARVMFENSVRDFDGMPEYLAQKSRALYHLADAQDKLGLGNQRALTLVEYERHMKKLSEKVGRKLKYEDLKDFTKNQWD